MRKIIAGLFITLDGVVGAPEKWNPLERNGVVALRYTLGHGTVAPTLPEVSQCAS
jgi:hypothetical protein